MKTYQDTVERCLIVLQQRFDTLIQTDMTDAEIADKMTDEQFVMMEALSFIYNLDIDVVTDDFVRGLRVSKTANTEH